MREIKEGDKVLICFVGEEPFWGIVKSMPSATGDLLYIKVNYDNKIHAINTNCSSFEQIILGG